MKNFEETNFDSLAFEGVYEKQALSYMCYQIWQRYDF